MTQRIERIGFGYMNTIQHYTQQVLITQNRIQQKITLSLDRHKYALDTFQSILMNSDPQMILNKGYSITKIYDKIITDISQISPGDTLETYVKNGSIKSIVTKK
jgi:exodeoxyribonuclease VII large subunit